MNTPQDLIGRSIAGKFVITDVLGEGAMGIVYRGFDESTLAEVAIKVLQPSLAVHPEIVARFYREAAAARRIDHEGTVRVLGRGEENGLFYLVMELLHGRSLAELLIAEGRLAEQRAARILVQVCGALAVAHERGVVHRDIKPDNIMLMDGGEPSVAWSDGAPAPSGERVKVLDFGVAKPMARGPGAVEDSFTTGEVTRYGALVGTPEYMSPEQCAGCEIDQRADIYACGVVLYRMVTGRVPFDGRDLHLLELCQRHLGEDPPAPREVAPWVSAEMEAVILKALRKSPSQRQQTAAELRDDLLGVLGEMPAKPRPVVVDPEALGLARTLGVEEASSLMRTLRLEDVEPAPATVRLDIPAVNPLERTVALDPMPAQELPMWPAPMAALSVQARAELPTLTERERARAGRDDEPPAQPAEEPELRDHGGAGGGDRRGRGLGGAGAHAAVPPLTRSRSIILPSAGMGCWCCAASARMASPIAAC